MNNIAKQKFGMLTALWPVDVTVHNGIRQNVIWLFRCDCGKEKKIVAADVIRGRTVSCGCKKFKGLQDLLGMKFGKLTVIKFAGKAPNRSKLWEAECECGKVDIYRHDNLIHNRTTSCGCSRKK